MRLRATAAAARQPLYLLKGQEKKSGEILNALIFGKDMSLAFLSDLIYSAESAKVNLGKSFIWKVRSKARAIQPHPDLILVEHDRLHAGIFERQGFTLIPKWVFFTLDISKPMPEFMRAIRNRSLENNLRKMRKYQYSYELTQDPEKFHFFYHQMYIPYTVQRYGEASWILEYDHLRRLLKNGQLLLTKQNDKPLAGVLLIDRNKSLFSHSLGVKDGNEKYVERGAITASYYFTIQWAKERGYSRIDFGYCRPFLRDGVFVYKRRWGMVIDNSDRSMGMGVFGLKVYRFTKSVLSFLKENPFIFIDRDKIRGLIFVDQFRPLTFKDVQLLMRIHHIEGLDSMVIVSSHGFTHEARGMAKARYGQLLHLTDMDVEAFFGRFPSSEDWTS